MSIALICPKNASNDDRVIWEKVCKRACRIASGLSVVGEESLFDAKGHDICTEEGARYAFCTLCFLSRRVRDYKWIATRECTMQMPGWIHLQQLMPYSFCISLHVTHVSRLPPSTAGDGPLPRAHRYERTELRIYVVVMLVH